MFTGLISETTKAVSVEKKNQSISLVLKRPDSFKDLSIGQSLACHGVCLSLEDFDKEKMRFTIGYETLKITGWKKKILKSLCFHLEKPLKTGDPLDGHWVTGHVDASVKLTAKKKKGDCVLLNFQLPKKYSTQIFEKCCIAINGVSLTVNQVKKNQFQVCLVPETIKKTRLADLEKGDSVNIETDYSVKAIVNSVSLGNRS